MKKFALVMVWIIAACSTYAQYGLVEQGLKCVTVTGRAAVLESPDKIVIQVTLSDEYCAGPKENIDALTTRYTEAVASCGVEKSKSKLLKELRFDLGYTTARKTSEMISRSYQLELTSTKQYDTFCQGMISKGVSIEIKEITSTRIPELKQRAQREAMLAAKDKALNYVSVVDGKLGRVIRIDENSENYTPAQQSTGDELAEGVAFPMISNDFIEYDVQVVFELQ